MARDEALLHLTEAEAREMRDKLEALLADAGNRHEHVASADFQVEVTIWLDRGGAGRRTVCSPSADDEWYQAPRHGERPAARR